MERPESWPKHLRDPLPRDWPEDATDPDNGCYRNECFHCKSDFIGNKRRPVCKTCAFTKPTTTSNPERRGKFYP